MEASSLPEKEIQSLFHGLLGDARKNIEAYPELDPNGLHNARKNIKRIRSLLRLLRLPDIKQDRRELNTRLSNAGKMLSGYRDIEVLMTFFTDLKESTKKRSPGIQKALEKVVAATSTSQFLTPSESSFHQTRLQFKDALDEIESRFNRVSLQHFEWADLDTAFEKSLKRMRKCAKQYGKEPDEEALHQLRKRIKDIFYQQQFLQGRLGISSDSISQTKAIESSLGSIRDCDLAMAYITQLDEATLSLNEEPKLRRCIKRQREQSIGQLSVNDFNLIGS